MFFRKKRIIENRRKQARIDILSPAFCKNIGLEDRKDLHNCVLKNISLKGLSFALKDRTLNVNDNVQILYQIGIKIRNDFLSIRNESKFLNDWRYGCEFESPDPIRDSLIQEYASKQKN